MLASSLWLATCTGCATAPKVTWPEWTHLGKKDDDGVKILTPKDKMEQLRALTKAAAKMTPEKQEAVAVELARGIATEQDVTLRAQILRTLAAYPTETATKILVAALNDKDRNVRIAACEGLGKHGGPEVPKELGRVLAEDSDLDVRLAAARGLGTAAHPNSIAPLGQALDDPDPAMQLRVMASLKEASGRDYGNDTHAWREFVQGGQPKQPEESLAQRLFKWF